MPTVQELIGQIENRIRFATHGRVRSLHVELSEQAIVLHGRAGTYYAKQLAQHATQCVLAERPIVNVIEVG